MSLHKTYQIIDEINDHKDELMSDIARLRKENTRTRDMDPWVSCGVTNDIDRLAKLLDDAVSSIESHLLDEEVAQDAMEYMDSFWLNESGDVDRHADYADHCYEAIKDRRMMEQIDNRYQEKARERGVG